MPKPKNYGHTGKGGFDNESQRRAVMAILTQRLTGIKPGPGEKLAGMIPGTARHGARKMFKKKPAKAGKLLKTGRKDLRRALLKDYQKREGKRNRQKLELLRELMEEANT